jgi:NhaP-type Na+/H+ or K+/H+ antiporter
MLLLPAGFLAGMWWPDAVDPTGIFGASFTQLVNLTVAVILFHGGLELSEERLLEKDRRIIFRFITLGALMTWAAAAVAVALLLPVPKQIALLIGAICIVSGPTVVAPLLEFVRPQIRVRRILAWEGTLIDPVGALVAVVVFQGVLASAQPSVGAAVSAFLGSVGVGLGIGLVGTAFMWAGMKLARDSRILRTEVLLASAVVGAGVADAIRDDAGLVTAIVMGLAGSVLIRHEFESVKPFFDTVVKFSVGILFVSISSLVTPESLQGLVLPALGVVLILVLIVRPLIAFLLTTRTTLLPRQRGFLAWMAPRGIVAAATASSFGTTLTGLGVEGADKLLPSVFLIIVGTVVIYSLTAVPVAAMLGVRCNDPTSPTDGMPEEDDDIAVAT